MPGLPFGRPNSQPPRTQFLDERRRSLEPRVPVKGIVFAYLTSTEVTKWFEVGGLGKELSPYRGWALCNGENDTPDLRDKFVRVNTTASGGTGGSDSSAHTHTAGTYVAKVKLTDTKILAANTATDSWAADYSVTATGYARTAPDTDASTEGAGVQGTSSAASSTENRPAYCELVAVMRIV